LIDVRLKNTSHLAGFAKKEDLEYFLQKICGAEYRHEPTLAPTEEILDAYQKKAITWEEYKVRFHALLAERAVERTIDRQLFAEPAVLLCSEPKADHCHRRLVAEYLAEHWGDARIIHL
jgi:uncharacterized protein (DUF488 family)